MDGKEAGHVEQALDEKSNEFRPVALELEEEDGLHECQTEHDDMHHGHKLVEIPPFKRLLHDFVVRDVAVLCAVILGIGLARVVMGIKVSPVREKDSDYRVYEAIHDRNHVADVLGVEVRPERLVLVASRPGHALILKHERLSAQDASSRDVNDERVRLSPEILVEGIVWRNDLSQCRNDMPKKEDSRGARIVVPCLRQEQSIGGVGEYLRL